MSRHRISSLPLLLSWALIVACASSPPALPGDASFEAGDLAAAASSYQRDLWQVEDPALQQRTLWRLALACCSEEAWNPDCAQHALRRLVEDHPRGRYAASGASLLQLHEQWSAAAAAAKQTREEQERCRSAQAHCVQHLESAEGQLQLRSSAAGERMEALEAARRKETDLLQQLADSQQEIQRLRRELARLQAIDLATSP
ncbi:MAG: hypothetical protein AAGD01_06100 [Acidobacteriota bacterium]